MNENMKNVPETAQAPAPKKRRPLNRKWRFGAASTALTAVVIAGVVLLNLVADIVEARFPLTLDLTAEETYTLSDTCLDIVADIEDEVQVIAFQDETYFSSPSLGDESLNTIARQFYEGMKQCNVTSGGKIKTRYINFADNPTLVAQYSKYDVAESDILFICGDRFAVTSLVDMFEYDQQTYMYYGAISVTASLVDQKIATNLRKVTGELAPVVVMTGHNEDAYTLQNVQAALKNNAYDVITCDLTKSEKITDQAITMVIPAPATDYSAAEIVAIREWLQQGGEYSRNLVVLTPQTADCPNLFELVQEEYGIEITSEMVCETKDYYTSPYYAYGTVEDSEFTSELADDKVLSLFTRRLVLHKENNPDLFLYNTPLVTFGTSAKLADISAKVEEGEEPETYAAPAYPIVGAAYAHKQVPSPTTNENVHSYVAVFGSPYFLDTSILNYVSTAKNEEVFIGVFNNISGAEDAVAISGRTMNQNVLTLKDGTSKWLGIGVFTVGFTVVALAAGLIVFLRRRRL